MDKQLAEYMDTRRWIAQSGIMTDDLKNNLFMYGSILHRNISAVDLTISMENNRVDYKIFIPKDVLKKLHKYERLLNEYNANSLGWYNRWRFANMLSEMKTNEERLDFEVMLNHFVRDLLGGKWSASCEIISDAHFDDNEYNTDNSK